jgi:predicted dehydrogenase
MNGKRIRWGLLGGGRDSMIGIVHRIAASMGDDYVLVGGVFNSRPESSEKLVAELELDPARSYRSVEALVGGESQRPDGDRMALVTVATPNYLHFEMASRLVQGGFHVICEKPVTTTVAEAVELAALIKARGVVFAVAHTYTGYPMVRQMRAMIARGLIGKVQKVEASYYQGWINPIIHDRTKWNSIWRLDPALSGPSCCMGDIGVHAFNLIEYTTGLTVTQSLADIDTLYPDNPMDVDGSALLRLSNGARGVLSASQIATAEENNLRIAVYGRLGALKWAQENPNRLEFLREREPLALFTPGHPYDEPEARAASKLPPGHPEGLIDAMGNIYRGVAQAIRGEVPEPGAFPGIEDGVRGMRFVEAVLESARSGNRWVAL